MRVLFLDVDGVLNSRAWYEKRANYTKGMLRAPDDFHPNVKDNWLRHQLWELDPEAVKLVGRIVEENDFKVVISSTWRIGTDIETFYQLFRLAGWGVKDGTIIGKTPLSQNRFRGDEINEWLKANPPCEYMIIDDDSDFHFEQKRRHLKTDTRYGIQPWHHELAPELLFATEAGQHE